jgi:hypothetical protein
MRPAKLFFYCPRCAASEFDGPLTFTDRRRTPLGGSRRAGWAELAAAASAELVGDLERLD